MTNPICPVALTMRYLRLQKDMTIQTMASKTGLNASSLSAWESGRSEPRASELMKIADALGTSVDVLVGNGERKAVRCGSCEGLGIVWEKKAE